MRKSQSVKVKGVGRIAGSASGLGLLLLAFLLANPLMGLSASALEGSEDVGDSGEPAAQAEVLTSTVSFAFGEPVGVTTLTPVSESGASARYSVKATVGVENSGGYTVYLGSNKSELTGKNSGATINGVTSSSSYESLPVNSWGYNATEGETAGTSFSRMPENVRGVALGGNDASNIKSDSKTFMLSFAAHIGNDKPADTYENEVTLSVVSSPLEITGLTSLTNMQEMTSAVCEASEIGETKQLIDVRDGKSYWVAELKDNNCWMTQNLDLDLGTEWPDASLSDYDVASTEYKPMKTIPDVKGGSTSGTGTYSWDLGSFISMKPELSTGCGNITTGLSSCTSYFLNTGSRTASNDAQFYNNNEASYTATEYDAHYLVGNLYQWNAATAGSGNIMNAIAPSSICPKNWKLPDGNSSSDGSFAYLLNRSSATKVEMLAVAPFYFVRSGLVNKANSRMEYAGSDGYYWSSTAGNATQVYRMKMGVVGTNADPNFAENRYVALSVRCVAR